MAGRTLLQLRLTDQKKIVGYPDNPLPAIPTLTDQALAQSVVALRCPACVSGARRFLPEETSGLAQQINMLNGCHETINLSMAGEFLT